MACHIMRLQRGKLLSSPAPHLTWVNTSEKLICHFCSLCPDTSHLPDNCMIYTIKNSQLQTDEG